jgi:hypothetical protein
MTPGSHHGLGGSYINYGNERDSVKHSNLIEVVVYGLCQYTGHSIGKIIIINSVPDETQTTKLQIHLKTAQMDNPRYQMQTSQV